MSLNQVEALVGSTECHSHLYVTIRHKAIQIALQGHRHTLEIEITISRKLNVAFKDLKMQK